MYIMGLQYSNGGREGLYLVDVRPDQVIQFVEDPVYHLYQQMALLREGG